MENTTLESIQSHILLIIPPLDPPVLVPLQQFPEQCLKNHVRNPTFSTFTRTPIQAYLAVDRIIKDRYCNIKYVAGLTCVYRQKDRYLACKYYSERINVSRQKKRYYSDVTYQANLTKRGPFSGLLSIRASISLRTCANSDSEVEEALQA